MIKNLIWIVGMLFLAGCGGGGGDDGGSTTTLSYTGLTSSTDITSQNATPVAVNSFENTNQISQISSGGSVTGLVESLKSDYVSMPLPAVLTKLMVQFMDMNQLRAMASESVGGIQESETVYGSCGGSMTISLSGPDSGFSGSVSYNGFCEFFGVTISGTIGLTGSVSSSAETISMNMTFSNIQSSYSGVLTTNSGSMSLILNTKIATVTIPSFLSYNATSGQTSKMENGLMTMTFNSLASLRSVSLTMSGTFFDPTYGKVELATVTPFIISTSSIYPSSGAVTATGVNNEKTLLTVVDVTNVRIQADTDGDGIYDYDGGTVAWISL